MLFMRPLIAACFGLLLASPAWTQRPSAPRPGEELVDRVVAVVGDTVLLLSEVQTEIQRLQAAGQPTPEDPAGRDAFAREIVENRIRELILIQAARREGITVDDAEVTAQVEQQIGEVRQRFGSETALASALAESGLTVEQYRATLTQQARDAALTQRLFQQRLAGAARPAVTEAEIASFFQAQRGALGARPATVSFEQVIVRPEPSAEARAAARSTAEDVLRQLGAGGDFAVLARRFSADTGSGERGGELGWFRRGQMVRPFENAVYAMRPGETSGLVETEFGFHIIRLERIRAGERQARHILIRAEITEADQARARARADSVATALRGGASVPNLAERYGTPVDQRGGERVPLERLPPAYTTAFATASPGSIVGPFEIVPAPGSSAWAVARLGARQAAGEYTLDDVREQVRGRIQEQKMITEMVAELRRSMHVDVQL